MSKHIDADAFVELYKKVNKGVGIDHIISLINAMPDVSKTPAEQVLQTEAAENVSEEEREEIEVLLKSLYYEFMAQSAWSGHAYGFENMGEYAEKLMLFMKAYNLPTEKLADYYAKANEEYEKIAQSETLSFLNGDDTDKLEKYDMHFLEELDKAAQNVADFIGTEEKWLVFTEQEPELCGFVYRHSLHDYSAWRVDLKAEDRKEIGKILENYQTEGYSERNVFDEKFSEVFE